MMLELVLVGAAGIALAWWLGGRLAAARAERRARSRLDDAHAELSRRLNELFSLQELVYVLSEPTDLDRVAGQIAHYVLRFVPCDGVLVALSDEAGDTVRVVAADGVFTPFLGRTVRPHHQLPLVDLAMATAQLTASDAMEDAAPFPSLPVRQAVALPLRAHGFNLGAIAVAKRHEEAFGQSELRLLSTVATHASTTMASARFFSLLRHGKEEWETTFDALSDGVALVDRHGRIRRANRALAVLLDAPLPSIIGIDLGQALFNAPADVSELLQAARAGEQRAPLTLESDRLECVLRLTASPIRGEPAAGSVVILIEDVTEQLALETQLIQSEKMAAVGQLVSGVAHELNNPLTSIAGLAEFLLEQRAASDREQEHLRVIHEQADRAASIVRNLLTFARQGPAETADVDLNEVVRRATALIGYELELRQVDLVTELAEHLPTIRGDRYQIQQVVLNLLTNAAHAVGDLPPGRPRKVFITTRREGGDAVLRVADSGPGIPEEIRPRIFDPFVTTKAPGQGTGLGLAITYRIVEGHNGTIAVDRAPEGGGALVVRLPIAHQPSPPRPVERPAPTAPESPAPSAAPREEHRHRVLLVDDDPAVLRAISALFAHEGQHVEPAASAACALSLLERGAYDLVIADARAAVSAGQTFAEAALARYPDLRARTILLTADVREETEQWLRTLGCAYFRKPFNVRQLRSAAEAILGAPPPPDS